MSFSVLFVCICVLYYCHRVATQLQLTLCKCVLYYCHRVATQLQFTNISNHIKCRIDTINSPDDGHMCARNMKRIEINIYEKELCVKLVIYKDCSVQFYMFWVFIKNKQR